MNKKTDDYSDMIYMEYTGTKTHKPQPMEKRATQFSPFAALTGYEEIIDDVSRYVADNAD